jgi:pimeloyl-ACP methyl ester carboxylesterase
MTGMAYAKGVYQSGEGQLVSVAPSTPLNGTRKGVLCFHGHGADATQFADANQPPAAFVKAMADSGLIVMSIDEAGQTGWSGPNVMTACTNAYNWLTGAGGAMTGKIGVMGWSMGGLTALNWIKRNPTKVGAAWLWAPAADLDLFNATSGYTPSYSTAYTGSPTTVPANTPGNVAAGGFASEIAAVFGSGAAYTTGSAGYRVRDEYSSWHGLGIPIKVCHAPDDQTIPMALSQAFVSGVNDPNVTFLQAATGGHTQLFNSIDPSVVLAHYNSIAW